MAYRVSIPAKDPARVAAVLAELTAGRAEPFHSFLPGTFMVVSEETRIAIEVYPTEPALVGKPPRRLDTGTARDPDAGVELDFPLTVPLDRAAIEQIGKREGWRTQFLGGVAPGTPACFHLMEFWLENRILVFVRSRDPQGLLDTNLSESEAKRHFSKRTAA
jgi:hypothetical protein